MSINIHKDIAKTTTTNFLTRLSRHITDSVSPYIPGFTTERALISLAVIVTLKKTVDIISTNKRHKVMLDKAKQKRTERDDQILKEFTPTIEIPEEITTLVLGSTVTQLAQLLNDDKVTSEQVLKVYHNRAIVLGLRLELIADSNFEEALMLAKRCDEIRKNTPKEERHTLGPLFGVPISVKDSFEQQGLDSTVGLAKNCFAPCKEDGSVVKLLKAQGALPFVRGNSAQSLTVFETMNHIWGRAANPWNLDRTTGGSSGGDAGLVASNCAPLGFGSDYFGSIRIPAAFCGVYGIKVTSGRYAVNGEPCISPYDLTKFTFLRASTGPIGKSVDDIASTVKGMIRPETRLYDPLYPLVPWSDEKYNSKGPFRIGYIETEDFFGAAQPCRRAVKEAVAALKKAGHDVIEVRIPNFDAMILHVLYILTMEGGARRHLSALDGEKAAGDVKTQLTLGEMPDFAKKLMKPLLGKRLQHMMDSMLELPAKDLMLKLAQFCELRSQFLKFWVDYNLDALITPVSAVPAYKHNYGSKLIASGCYLWPANIINAPAGVVPITKVLPGEDVYTADDSLYVGDALFQFAQETMKGSVGLPVGVQVMSLPFEDEKCLAVMREIESEIQFHELPTVE